MNFYEIYNRINEAAPFARTCDWDNSGIAVYGKNEEVKKVLTCLDITCDVAREAAEGGYDLVVSHHPVIFKGLKTLTVDNPAVVLSQNGIWALCAHTNADTAEEGLSSLLCEMLGLEKSYMEHLSYDGKIPFGVIGGFTEKEEITGRELAVKVKEALGCRGLRFCCGENKISRVGICTGSGGDFVGNAIALDCDALITGDVKHNFFIDAKNNGFTLIDAGHYYTEAIFSKWISGVLEGADVEIFRAKSDIAPFEVI